ncbi:MAG: hypothetical protein ACRD01_02780 [Terriglobales bacterium]
MSLAGPGGREISGTITVASAGAAGCKITVQLGAAALQRQYTAVMKGTRVHISGPAALVRAVPLAIGPRVGCALLPQAVLAGAATVPLRGQTVTLAYAGSTVTETVAGAVLLMARFSPVAPHDFAASEFALPPRPPAPPGGAPAGTTGGGQ